MLVRSIFHAQVLSPVHSAAMQVHPAVQRTLLVTLLIPFQSSINHTFPPLLTHTSCTMLPCQAAVLSRRP